MTSLSPKTYIPLGFAISLLTFAFGCGIVVNKLDSMKSRLDSYEQNSDQRFARLEGKLDSFILRAVTMVTPKNEKP